jgi:hypothetical protein
VKIMTLGVNGVISPASAAGHVVLSSNLTAWDIRGTQPCSQMPGPCRPHAVRRVIHGNSRSCKVTARMGWQRMYLSTDQEVSSMRRSRQA